jgi:hypothetical protein
MRWKVIIEAAFYTPGGGEQVASAEFTTELLAKRFARSCLRTGHIIRVETEDGSLSVNNKQIAAWLIGSPREVWPS